MRAKQKCSFHSKNNVKDKYETSILHKFVYTRTFLEGWDHLGAAWYSSASANARKTMAI